MRVTYCPGLCHRSDPSSAPCVLAGFPTINWYGKREFSIGKGESYSGSRSVAGLLDFVNSKTGWGIAPGGGLDQKAGLVKKLDLLVKEWVTHAKLPEHLIEPARETVLVRARVTADGLMQEGEKRDAKTYISIFEKVLWKDENHVQVLRRSHTLPSTKSARVLTLPRA